jgi:hypothetical protein
METSLQYSWLHSTYPARLHEVRIHIFATIWDQSIQSVILPSNYRASFKSLTLSTHTTVNDSKPDWEMFFPVFFVAFSRLKEFTVHVET